MRDEQDGDVLCFHPSSLILSASSGPAGGAGNSPGPRRRADSIRSTHDTAAGTIRTCNSRFLRPPPLPLGYCGSHNAFNQCSELDSNQQHRDSQSRASAKLGYQSARVQRRESHGHRRELNPHRLGANQESCQLDDGPSSTSITQWSRQDSNLQRTASEAAASASWATEPSDFI